MSDEQHVYCDFEYKNDCRTAADLICGCFLHHETGERVALDLRTPDGLANLSALVARWQDCIWMAYACHAEMTALLTAGIDISGMAWIDLMGVRQITGSHPYLKTIKGDL